MSYKNPKYELTEETMEFEGRTLRRIRYLRHMLDSGFLVKKDSLGGWLEHEGNLSHDGACIVLNEAKVYGEAHIKGNSKIINNAIVKDNALITDETMISGNAIVGADTYSIGTSNIRGNSNVFFYQNPLDKSPIGKRKPNIMGECLLRGNAVVEATGFIKNTVIRDRNIYGEVALENKKVVKR